MLAKRLDPIDAYRQRAYPVSPVYRKRLRSRKLSIHARFVARATEVFPGARLLENIPASEIRESKPPIAEVAPVQCPVSSSLRSADTALAENR